MEIRQGLYGAAMNHVDLFSGIGGFALAARWAGIQTVQFVEIDPFCQKVLQKNFPGVPIHDDIKTFDGTKYPNVFLLTGGFPCQPFSCAGKRMGAEDDRALWPEMLRVIQEVRPYWIIGENVAGIIGMELDNYISDLEREGYTVQAFVIPACAVGAPHRRDRVWIVAHTKSERSRGKSEKICGEKCRPFNELLSNTFNTDRHAADTSNQGLPGCERPGSHEQGQTTHGSTPERNHAWDEPWIEAATRLCRVDARVSNRVDRLKALGNAIVPQVAFEIMKAILKVSG